MMVRPRRPDFTRTYHHVVIRGIDGLELFDSEGEREKFLEIMREVRTDHDLSVYALGFLTNHLHLFVRRNEHSLGRFFQRLKGQYTQWYNSQYDRNGTLYDGQYFSSLVDSDAYFRSMWEYVQRQGVSAGLYESPIEDPWSTAQLYVRGDERFNWIDWEEALRELDIPGDEGRVNWNDNKATEWLNEGLSVRRHRQQRFVAKDEFVEKYMQIRKKQVREQEREESPISWETMIGSAEVQSGLSSEELLKNTKQQNINKVRCLMAWAGRRFCHLPLSSIADKMNVSEPTVSKMIKRAQEKHQNALREWDRYLRNRK